MSETRSAKPRVIIEPGEIYATRKAIVIQTTLGSCVSVCLRDATNGVSGMNHFVVPHDPRGEGRGAPTGRYGVYAMQKLIAEVEARDAQRMNLVAKVFGGGCIAGLSEGCFIAKANADFVLKTLTDAHIAVAAQDLGGDFGRLVTFDTSTGLVRVRRLEGRDQPSMEPGR